MMSCNGGAVVYIDGGRRAAVGDVTVKSAVLRAGEASFTVRGDVGVGCGVEVMYGGGRVFSGRVFSVSRASGLCECRAFDAVRYLYGRDAFAFSSVTLSAVVRSIAARYGIPCGKIAETGYKIESIFYDGRAIDVIADAVSMTEAAGFGRYVLACADGEMSLLPFSETVCAGMIGESTASVFSVNASIGDGKYNYVTLVRDTDEGRQTFVSADSADIERYGRLSYLRRLRDGELGQLAADAEVRMSAGVGVRVSCVLPRAVPEMFGGCGVRVLVDGNERIMVCESCENVYGRSPVCKAVLKEAAV